MRLQHLDLFDPFSANAHIFPSYHSLMDESSNTDMSYLFPSYNRPTPQPLLPVSRPKERSPRGSSPSRGSPKRKQSYSAPAGVWKTPAGHYISAIYVGKRRFYGPVRYEVEVASADRLLMDAVKKHNRNDINGITRLIAELKTQQRRI